MVSRVLVALAALIAVAHADSTFDLRWTGENYMQVMATSVTDCFAKTNMTVHFTYGFTYASETGDDTTTQGWGARSCATTGTNDQVNMYADMVWAFPRGGGDAVCLQFDGAASVGSIKPDATKTTFNQNYKYAITRSLAVCAYDSYFTPLNGATSPALTAKETLDVKNGASKPKLSYQSDTWMIYSSQWDGSLTTGSDWSQISTWCAGNCAAPFTNPSNDLYNDAAKVAARNNYEAFVDGDCVIRSEWTCGPGVNNTDCGYENDVSTSNWQKIDTALISEPVEKIACGASAQLLARSANFGGITSAAFMKTTTKKAMVNGAERSFIKYFDVSDVDTSIGLQEDIVGTNGLWSKITMFAPMITHFQGSAVSGPEYVSKKSFWLNNAKSVSFKFENANAMYTQTGFATTSLATAKNMVYIDSTLAANGNVPSLTQVAYDRETQTATFLGNNGRFSTNNQGSGNFGTVGMNYWARIKSSYMVDIKWTCNNLGTNSNSGNGYPYRFNCEKTIAAFTQTPGMTWNKPSNTFPTLKRQFTTVMYNTWTTGYNVVATSDPVFLGMFASATNAGFSVATSVPAVNGDAAKGVSSSTAATNKAADAQENQATGVALIGAGLVTLAVLGSFSICIGAAVLGKLQAK